MPCGSASTAASTTASPTSAGVPPATRRRDRGWSLKQAIFAGRVGLDGRIHDGVANFGRRPTFGDGAPLLEVHLFDFSDELYGRTLDVAFIGWIRAELRLEGIADLIRHMDDDS